MTLHLRVIMSFALIPFAPVLGSPAAPAHSVIVEIFGQPGCELCQRVETEVVPVLEARFGEQIRVERRDVGYPADLARLLAQAGATLSNDNPRVCVVVAGRNVFADNAVFSPALEEAIGRRVIESMEVGAAAPTSRPPAPNAAISNANHRFGWGVVLAAGLADGFNPCAIGTLVFFISLLAVARAGRWRTAAAGMAFCLGVFATYTVLGFGLMRACRAAEGLSLVRLWFRAGLTGMLAVLAMLSFRDAVASARSHGAASSVTLKLPRRLREASHRMVRQGVRSRWLVLGCVGMGVAVTLIEAVCTGQSYLPALAFMSRQGNVRALAMLLAYNVMFVLPLAGILVAALQGWRSVDMAAWTRKEVMAAKLALGLLFAVLGFALWLPE